MIGDHIRTVELTSRPLYTKYPFDIAATYCELYRSGIPTETWKKDSSIPVSRKPRGRHYAASSFHYVEYVSPSLTHTSDFQRQQAVGFGKGENFYCSISKLVRSTRI